MKTLHCTPCDQDVEPVFEVGDTGPEGQLSHIDGCVNVDIPLELNCPKCGTKLEKYTVQDQTHIPEGEIEAHNKCFITEGDDYEEPEFKIVVGTRKLEAQKNAGFVSYTVHLTCDVCTMVTDIPDTVRAAWVGFEQV